MIRSYHVSPFRNHINNGLIQKFNDREHPYGKLTLYPESPEEDLNYEETVLVNSYKDLLENYEPYLTNYPISPEVLFVTLQQVMLTEVGHTDELADLAIRIVTEFFNLNGEIGFDVKIGIGTLKGSDFKKEPKDEFTPELKPEVEKRLFINAFQQGCALKSTRAFQMYIDELAEISTALPEKYKVISEMAYISYFLTSPDMVKNMGADTPAGGSVKIEFREDKPFIVGRGLCFIFLLHELFKGVMECLSLVSIPKEKRDAEYVIGQTDNILVEHYSIVLGGEFWTKFYDLVSIHDYDIKSHIFTRIFAKETDEFNEFIALMLSNPTEATNQVELIAEQIRKDIREYDINQLNEDDDDDFFNNFMNHQGL